MFDLFFGKSYIILKNCNKIIVEESVSDIKSMINDSNSFIIVHVFDSLLGICSSSEKIYKDDIRDYGSN